MSRFLGKQSVMLMLAKAVFGHVMCEEKFSNLNHSRTQIQVSLGRGILFIKNTPLLA
jgi:hypothetical protein